MNRGSLIVLLINLTFSHHVFAFNILAIVSLPLKSHYMAMRPLFNELANRGHSVTVMNNFPDDVPAKNLKFINLNQDTKNIGYVTPLDDYAKFDSAYLHLYNVYRHFVMGPAATERDCENLFTNENVTKHFDDGVKYDVIFVEQFVGECGLAYAGAVYDSPIIGITSHVLLPWAYPRLGIPFDISSDSFYFSNAGPNPSLYHKIETLLVKFLFNTIGKWQFHHKTIYDVFSRHLPNKFLDIESVAMYRMKMMFVYQHFSLTGARLLSPQVLEIGGLHIGKPGIIPEVIESFLSSAEHGAIYISFGSNLKTNTMSRDKVDQFLNAFKNIPQKVIWKFENASLPAGHENVLTQNWFPQLEVLCHPKVKAFVSHGGMLSLSEAAHCGKPVLAMPFFGDQFGNAAAADAVGLGKVLFFEKLNSENLANGIQELLTPEMQENAKRISKQWHDRPISVMDSAIFWTEYVARHGSSPPGLPSQRSTWFETLLLDVAAVLIVLILAVFAALFVIYKLLKMVLVTLLGKTSCKTKPKKE